MLKRRRGLVPRAALVAAASLVVLTACASGEASPAGEGSAAREPASWTPRSADVCRVEPCQFALAGGGESLALRDGVLRRVVDGEAVFEVSVLGESERLLAADLSSNGNLLALAIARNRVDARGRSAGAPGPRAGSPGPSIHPADVDRRHRFELLNPKSGRAVKTIDLGAFLVEDLALTPDGEMVLAAGRELQLGVRQVRVYNARSGGLERSAEVRKAEAELGEDGYRVGSVAWRFDPGTGEPEGGLFGKDPYSIAEYRVSCSSRLDADALGGRPLAVRLFTGAEPELASMLSNGLILKLRAAGLPMVERPLIQELLDEQWLQDTGLTVDKDRAKIGQLENAGWLVLPAVEVSGRKASITARLVSVEAGRLLTGCEVQCRDCRPEDLLEGVDFLVGRWVGGARAAV